MLCLEHNTVMLENFLPTDTFSLHGHMAAVEDSKARDESKTATGCMLVDNDSSADGYRESDGSSAILDRSRLSSELMHP